MITNPHAGCESTRVGDRVSLAGSWSHVAENIMVNTDSEEKMVAKWIIDTISTNKVNRRNVFENMFTGVGVGVSDGTYFKNITVVNFANGFSCTSGTCPNIPNVDSSYDCSGDPFAHAGMLFSSIGLSLLVILSMLIFNY